MLYCKNEKCKEYRTGIPHNCLNLESNLSRECGFINAPKSGATVVIPPEILDLVRFLAELWYDIEKVKWDASEIVKKLIDCGILCSRKAVEENNCLNCGDFYKWYDSVKDHAPNSGSCVVSKAEAVQNGDIMELIEKIEYWIDRGILIGNDASDARDILSRFED